VGRVAGPGELRGVRDQVLEHRPQLHRVTGDGRQFPDDDGGGRSEAIVESMSWALDASPWKRNGNQWSAWS